MSAFSLMLSPPSLPPLNCAHGCCRDVRGGEKLVEEHEETWPVLDIEHLRHDQPVQPRVKIGQVADPLIMEHKKKQKKRRRQEEGRE